MNRSSKKSVKNVIGQNIIWCIMVKGPYFKILAIPKIGL